MAFQNEGWPARSQSITSGCGAADFPCLDLRSSWCLCLKMQLWQRSLNVWQDTEQYKAKQSTRQQRIFEAKFKGLKLFTQEKEQLQENILHWVPLRSSKHHALVRSICTTGGTRGVVAPAKILAAAWQRKNWVPHVPHVPGSLGSSLGKELHGFRTNFCTRGDK